MCGKGFIWELSSGMLLIQDCRRIINKMQLSSNSRWFKDSDANKKVQNEHSILLCTFFILNDILYK